MFVLDDTPIKNQTNDAGFVCLSKRCLCRYRHQSGSADVIRR